MLPNCKVPVLGIDVGRTWGWAMYRDGVRRSGTQHLNPQPGEPLAQRWEAFRELIEGTMRELEPGVLAYEKAPIVPGKRMAHDKLLALVGFEVTILSAAHRCGWDFMAIGPSSLKLHTVGNGRADKDLMISWACEKCHLLDVDEHEADAICVREWAIWKINGGK